MYIKDISLIVPIKDEASTIQELIDSISGQTLLPKEVIFVDGGSTDDTKEILKENTEKTSFRIDLIEVEKAYPGEARNLGIKKAAFDLIAFTDAGIRLDKRWLEELLRPIEEDANIDVVYGAYEPVVDSFLKECSLIAYIPQKKEAQGRAFRTDFIASSLFKKRIFDRIGGFPPFRAAEDKIFMDKVKSSGAKIYYTDMAKVYWSIPPSLAGIFTRFREFSAHDLMAGRAGDWHHSVFRTYAALLVLLSLGIFVNRLFFWGIAGLWLLRLARIFYRKRLDFKLKFIADVRYLFTIWFIILLTDMALFSGSVKYLRLRHGQRP